MLEKARDFFQRSLKSEPVQNFLVYGLGALFLKGVSFFLLPFYTKFLSPSEYGQVELINTLVVFVSTLVALGLPSYMFMEYFQVKEEGRSQFLKDIVGIYLLVSTPFFLVLIIILFLFSRIFIPVGVKPLTINIAMAYAYILFFQSLYVNILIILKKAKTVTLYRVIIGAGTILANIYLIYILRIGITGVFLSLLVLTFISFLYPILSNWEEIRQFSFNINPKFIRSTLKIGSILMVGYLAYFGLNFVDRWFILYFLGEEKVGIYSLAFKFSSVLEALLISPALSVYSVYIYPKFAKGQFDQKIILLSTGVLTVFFVLGLIIQPIARFMINPKFYESLGLIIPLVMGYAFYFLSQINSLVILFSKDSRKLLVNISLAFLANISLNYFFLKYLSLNGAAYAFLFSNFLWFLISIFQSNLVKRKLAINNTLNHS